MIQKVDTVSASEERNEGAIVWRSERQFGMTVCTRLNREQVFRKIAQNSRQNNIRKNIKLVLKSFENLNLVLILNQSL